MPGSFLYCWKKLSKDQQRGIIPTSLYIKGTNLTPNWVSVRWTSLWCIVIVFSVERRQPLHCIRDKVCMREAFPATSFRNGLGLAAEDGKSCLQHCFPAENEAQSQAPLLYSHWSHKADTCTCARAQDICKYSSRELLTSERWANGILYSSVLLCLNLAATSTPFIFFCAKNEWIMLFLNRVQKHLLNL